ncbi:MAG: caspase family protein [Pseudomonadota bacterium]
MKAKVVIVFLAAAVFLSLLSAPVLAERRLALVVGNGDYQFAQPLANPVNDARAMADKLESLGFETYAGFDLDRFGMERLLRDFTRASKDSDLNVFFYAGHGMAVGGTNYLVPIDAAFEDETAVDFEAIAVDFVTRQMTLSDAVNLVFLDACRDNPLSRSLARSMGTTRSAAIGNGLAEMKIANPGKGMAIAFATSPGDVALDGEGNNSPFTTALLRHLDAENTDIAEVFTRVTGDVYESTNQAQRPWINVSLTGPVALNPVERATTAVDNVASLGASTENGSSPTNGAMLEEQKLLFSLARETGDVEDYKAYLDSFPNGLYANNARRMIRKLEGESTQTASLSTSRNSSPAHSGAVSRADAIDEFGPLVLRVTPALQSLPATEITERDLQLDRTLRGNIQSRLNATGNNVGVVDGQWGPKTRSGIASWQSMNGLMPSGYLNMAQYELLVAQTEGRYAPYQPQVRRSSGQKTTKKNVVTNNNIGAALLGVAIGTILSK